MKILLFIDPVTGEKLFYEELRQNLSAETVDYAPFVQPATPGAAVHALLQAVILGQPLTLFDTDFSSEEREALGGTEARLEQRIGVEGLSWIDTATIRKEARQQTGFCLTLFTSGTTGRPKQVTHSLAGLTRMLKVSPTHAVSVWGLAYNPTHIAGVQVILQAFFNGNPLVNLFQANRETIVRALDEHKVTHLSATPSFYRLLLPLKTPCSQLRAITLGGERADTALIAKLRKAVPSARVRNLYASTEVGTLLISEGEAFAIPAELSDRVIVRNDRLWIHRSLVAASPPPVNGKLKIENGGKEALPPEDEKLEMEDGMAAQLPGNGDGLIENKGALPSVNRELKIENENNPLTNNDSPITAPTGSDPLTHNPLPLTASPLGDAWFDTGDDVEVVSNDPLSFRILAREQDWVNVGGHKVNPHEVEDLLRSHPDIREAKVFGRKNSVMGQVLCAEVVFGKAESRKQKAEITEPLENGKWKMKKDLGKTESKKQISDFGKAESRKQKAEMDFRNGESGKQKPEITEPLENGKGKMKKDLAKAESGKQISDFGKAESRKQKAEIDFRNGESGKQKPESRERGAESHLTDEPLQLSDAQLRAWLVARLQPVKIPRFIKFVDKLGTTRTGKMKR